MKRDNGGGGVHRQATGPADRDVRDDIAENGEMSVPPEMYTDNYYLHVCGGYEEFRTGGLASRLEHAIQLGMLAPGMTVLDVGSGRGEMAVRCAEAGCSVCGIDYSAAALTISSALLENRAHGGPSGSVGFQRMNSKFLGFPSRCFDRAFLIDVVEHLYPDELRDTLLEVRRVIKPGGRIVVHTAPNAWLIKPIYYVAGLLLGWRRHPWHVNEQSIISLNRSLAVLGGEVKVEVSKVPGFFKLGVGPGGDNSPSLRTMAQLLDAVFDSALSVALVEDTPLRYLYGTDLWATIDVRSEMQAVEARAQ
jgi:2-polyprenyl-3-methyl-5-hydroxy-6-metoxy-1,4-benzoquinol methylase